MSKGTALTAHAINLCIKYGMSLEEVAEKYNMTVAELEKKIRQLYKKNAEKADSILRALKNNRKKLSGRKKSKKESKDAGDAETVNQSEVEPSLPSAKKTLADLKEEEISLSNEVVALEIKHKGFSAQHRESIHSLRELQEQIKAIEPILKDIKTKYDSVAAQADAIAVKMNDISKIRSEKMATLAAVRQDIKEKSRITLYVYDDGIIDTSENVSGLIIKDNGYEQLKPALSEREECQELRVRDITTLARLLKICENGHIEPKDLILVCDNQKLEDVFRTIRDTTDQSPSPSHPTA